VAYEETLVSISLDADSSIGIYTGVPGQPVSPSPHGGKQYCFVKLTAAHTAGLCTAGTDVHIGVLQNKPQQTGGAATVAISGVSKVLLGTGGATAGNKLAAGAAGSAVVDATNGRCIALATGSAGDLIPVLLRF